MDDGTDVSADDNIDNSPSRSLVEHRRHPSMLGVTEVLRLGVALRGDAGPDLVSRVKAAVLTQGRIELRECDGDVLGSILIDNGAMRDALSTFAGDTPAVAVSLRRDAAERHDELRGFGVAPRVRMSARAAEPVRVESR